MSRCVWLLFLVPRAAAGEIVLNEILYDPPGADAGREFVELLNAGLEPASLDGVVLEAGDGARPGTWRIVWQAMGGELPPGAFFVIGGDSVAGAHARTSVDLQNGPDAVRVRRGTLILDRAGYGDLGDSTLFETRPAADVASRSLARVRDGIDTGDNAQDFAAATPSPGRRNALLVDVEARLEPPDPRRGWPGRLQVARVAVRNRGLEAALGCSLAVHRRMVAGEPWRDAVAFGAAEPLAVVPAVVNLAASESTRVEVAWSGLPGLAQLVARVQLAADEDPSNDVAREWVRIGSGAILINEIQFAPAAPAPEWIELWNRGDRGLELDEWTLADAGGRRALLAASRAVPPGGYAIAAADTSMLEVDPQVVRIVVRPWPALNNTDGDDGFADDLVLRDSLGIVQDALRYRASDGVPGRSLERLTPDAGVRGLLWAACKDPSGATPGRANSAAGLPRPRLEVQCAPNPFTPDDDGRDDALGITVELPTGAAGWRVRVFDLEGRARATLAADRLGPGPRHAFWDGRDARGAPLPTGVYVLHLEVMGAAHSATRRVVGLVRP